MKRIGMLVVGTMVLCLAACGGEQPSEEKSGEVMSQEQGLTQQCGLTCSSGHPATYLCSSSCSGFPCSTYNNAVQCEANTGSSFDSCGTTCPSPYRVQYAYGTYLCSKTVNYLGGNNAVHCVR
jgi:hypothetical protein